MQTKDIHARNTSFSRAVIAGALCGIVAALLNVVYDLIYRSTTGFETDKLISPVPIFFAIPGLLIITAIIFYEMVEFIKIGKLIFTILFLVIMAISIITLTRGAGSAGLRGLLVGVEIITGLCIAFLLPFLATHPKLFMEDEEYMESERD